MSLRCRIGNIDLHFPKDLWALIALRPVTLLIKIFVRKKFNLSNSGLVPQERFGQLTNPSGKEIKNLIYRLLLRNLIKSVERLQVIKEK